MFLCSKCSKEFANKSNLNRHFKSCQGGQIPSPVSEPDGKTLEAQGDIVPVETQVFVKESVEPEPNIDMVEVPIEVPIDVSKDVIEGCMDLTSIPANCELDLNISLQHGDRVFFDHLDVDDEHLWVKIDSWAHGRTVRKIHYDDVRSVMLPE
jgi:hypothetical protein